MYNNVEYLKISDFDFGKPIFYGLYYIIIQRLFNVYRNLE